jgi:hypothetical protein
VSEALDEVVAALSSKRYRYTGETVLHMGLAHALTTSGIDHEREVRVVGGRIDFIVGRIGIEVKVKGSAEALRRQIERYAGDDRFDEFLAVTTRPVHQVIAGPTHNDKPVRVLVIGGLSL